MKGYFIIIKKTGGIIKYRIGLSGTEGGLVWACPERNGKS